jgi:hypothetical protein
VIANLIATVGDKMALVGNAGMESAVVIKVLCVMIARKLSNRTQAKKAASLPILNEKLFPWEEAHALPLCSVD